MAPWLPRELGQLEFTLRLRQHYGVRVRIGDGWLRVRLPPSDAPPLTIAYGNDQVELAGGETYEARLPTAG